MPGKIAIPAAPEGFDYGQALEKALASALEPVCELERIKRKPFLTSKDVETLYGISRATLKAWRKDGKGPRFKQPDDNGPVWYTHEDMRAFFTKNQTV